MERQDWERKQKSTFRTQKSNDATVQFCWRPAAALTQRPESQRCVMMDALGGTKEPG